MSTDRAHHHGDFESGSQKPNRISQRAGQDHSPVPGSLFSDARAIYWALGGGGVGAEPFAIIGGGGVGAEPFAIIGGGGVGAEPFAIIGGGGVGAEPFAIITAPS